MRRRTYWIATLAIGLVATTAAARVRSTAGAGSDVSGTLHYVSERGLADL
jgi:hypothetical protein